MHAGQVRNKKCVVKYIGKWTGLCRLLQDRVRVVFVVETIEEDDITTRRIFYC